MLIPKFELGQKVYAVHSAYEEEIVHQPCETCNSTGRVEIKGRKGTYTCPICNGRMITNYNGLKYVISYKDAEIGKIEIQMYSGKYRRKHKSEIRYMLDATGVGSGTVWREERLFATEREAQEFCDKYKPADAYDMKEPVLK